MSTEPFTLNRDRVKFSHLNIRTEKHGDQDVTAIDLKFEMDTANNLLSKLDGGLRAALYRADENRELFESEHMPALRFPALGPAFNWALELKRVALTLHNDDGADIVLRGGKAGKFKIEPKEGGTVHWEFKVQFSEPDSKDIASLSSVLMESILISLQIEAEEESPDLFEQVEQARQAPMSEARQAAEKLFDDGGLGLPVEDLVQH